MAGSDRPAPLPHKDHPASRRAFVANAAALLQHDVCVSIVDLVTIRQFNLNANLLELVAKSEPILGSEPPTINAATVRGRKRIRRRPLLDFWFCPMAIGQRLPYAAYSLPGWN